MIFKIYLLLDINYETNKNINFFIFKFYNKRKSPFFFLIYKTKNFYGKNKFNFNYHLIKIYKFIIFYYQIKLIIFNM